MKRGFTSSQQTMYTLDDSSKISIRDNHEPLVDVKLYCPHVTIRLGETRMDIEKTAYLRKSVAEKLNLASQNLPHGMTFIIRDAWRPAYVQCAIYFDFLANAHRRFPNVSAKKRKNEVEKFVAPWSGNNASGHMTGGAIDLRILDKKGHLLPMRSRTLSYQENAQFDSDKLPTRLRANRQILASAMESAGFSNYPREFWHWTVGDFFWAKREGKAYAYYGAIPDHLDMYGEKACPCGSGDTFRNCHGHS